MFSFKGLWIAGLFAVSTLSANAATVASSGTMPSGDFTIQGGGTTVAVSDPSNKWYIGPTPSASVWIWDQSKVVLGGGTFGGPVTFLYSFVLTGFNAVTATLGGLVGLDDFGEIRLNGNLIFSDYSGNNYSAMQSYGTTNSSFFTAGTNTLSFFVNNAGLYPAGLRATVTVSADVSAVPVPAALPLLVASLGGFGFIGRRKKKAA